MTRAIDRFSIDGAGPRRLGFGCAPVAGRVGERASLRAMEIAFEYGVRHFDVARSYGFGEAERVVGRFARGRRAELTLTSKFGIVPPAMPAWKRLAKPLVRQAMQRLPGARRRVRTATAGLLEERRFDLAYARACLDRSLADLGTDHLDVYLLHEPAPALLIGAEELRGFLEAAVRSGRIGAWGLAHPHEASAFAPGAWGEVLQVEAVAVASALPGRVVDANGSARTADGVVFVTRPFGGGQRMHQALDSAHAAQAVRAEAVARALGLDSTQFAIACACAQVGARGAVIVGMFDEQHILANVRAAERYERDHARIDRALVDAGFAVREAAALPAYEASERP